MGLMGLGLIKMSHKIGLGCMGLGLISKHGLGLDQKHARVVGDVLLEHQVCASKHVCVRAHTCACAAYDPDHARCCFVCMQASAYVYV
jgi:hypothetical protein